MNKDFFPDGTVIDEWFYDAAIPELSELGKQYKITDYGIHSDGKVYTKELQSLIDTAAKEGGVIVVPQGIYITGALFFKSGVHLYVCKGGTLMGSDDISDYPVSETRIEGENCLYYPALINADGIDGFILCGKGTIDGNGMRSWKAFWQRRQWNPNCTNKDEQRPRLIYISNSKNVTISQLHLQNSHYWTNHIYKCSHVKFLGCSIFSPAASVMAPSTDAIDIDVCSDVLIKNCYLEVNDDAVALKGGKGLWADTLPENGANERIIIEDCKYGFCHSCLTCGSESIHNRNIIMRRINASGSNNLLWLKFRPDTPQRYEYILIEDAEIKTDNFIYAHSWTQFFNLKDRKDLPFSYANNIKIQNCSGECTTFFNVNLIKDKVVMSDFILKDLNIKAQNKVNRFDIIENLLML